MVKKMKRVERTVVKKCPECDQQCPVALRSCNCGYSFTRSRPSRQQTKQKAAAAAAAAAAAVAATSGASTSSKGTSKGSTTPSPESDANLDKVGRRFRTKRMRPDYFNSLELEYASRRYRSRKPKEDKDLKGKKKRGRPKGTTGIPRRSKEEKKKDEEEAKLPELDDLYANFTPQKMQQFSYILDELNFKMASQIFKPL